MAKSRNRSRGPHAAPPPQAAVHPAGVIAHNDLRNLLIRAALSEPIDQVEALLDTAVVVLQMRIDSPELFAASVPAIREQDVELPFEPPPAAPAAPVLVQPPAAPRQRRRTPPPNEATPLGTPTPATRGRGRPAGSRNRQRPSTDVPAVDVIPGDTSQIPQEFGEPVLVGGEED